METTLKNNTHYFLQNGGELGKLTREFDWSQTSLGSPDEWPQNLRTTVAMILSSKSPMFLWWGKNLVQFYNDAYRPSFGNNGKHPEALGQKGKDCWPEIWDVIYPLIQQVREKGESVWSEDQLIPIYRNGHLEDVYWTFGYNPIYGESGKVEGVLVLCTETTEKVKNRMALVENEARFRAMADNIPNLAWMADAEGWIFWYNKQWYEYTGTTPAQMEGWGWQSVHDANELPTVLVNWKDSIATGKPFEMTFPIKGANGEFRQFLTRVLPVYDQDGKINIWFGTNTDITEQKQTEEALKESEYRYRTLIEASNVATALYIGRNLRIQYANDLMIRYFGKDKSIMGKPLSDVLPELAGQPFLEILDHVFTSGKPYVGTQERADLMVDGQLHTFYFNFTYKALKDKNGEIYGIYHMAIDVTKEVIAKKELETSEQNLRNIILQAPVAMCILREPNFVVELANERMFELWGKTSEQVMHKPIFEGVPEVIGQGFDTILKGVYTTGKTFSAMDVPASLARNGKIETVYVNFVYEAYHEPDGSISGILVVAADVTEQVVARNKIEEVVSIRTGELAEVNSNLQKSNAELAQFAYIASHDLQEPLRKITIYSQMLESSLKGKLDAESKDYMKKIKNSSSRMITLVRDVLTYSELVKENVVFDKVDLNSVLESIKEDYDLLIEQKGATINYTKLPTIEAIPLQMSQLFSNIIANSLKFTKKGVKPVINITCSLLKDEELKKSAILDKNISYYKIQCSDNGIGFKPEYSEQIFNIFQRLHRKSEFEGTGIGLAMCKKIAINHNGELNADGSTENGAVFNVILPLKQNKIN